jgi:hypothetical protein
VSKRECKTCEWWRPDEILPDNIGRCERVLPVPTHELAEVAFTRRDWSCWQYTLREDLAIAAAREREMARMGHLVDHGS